MKLYLWKCENSEPGLPYDDYEVTSTNTPPDLREPVSVPGTDNLVYAESRYGAWELIGTVDGEAYLNKYEMCLVKFADETVMSLPEIRLYRRYTPCK